MRNAAFAGTARGKRRPDTCHFMVAERRFMAHVDKVLKTYADNGLRSAEDWGTMGRQVDPAAEPCAHAESRGSTVALYTRDQTRTRPPSPRRQRPAPAPK